MTRPPVRLLLAKELRALLPMWLWTLLAIGSGLAMGGLFVPAGLSAFVLGAVALGAQAVGHEYTHRTFGMLLVQPVDRRQLFAAKLAALAVALVTLAVLAWHMLVAHPDLSLLRLGFGPNAVPAVAALAFFVAPLLTLLARGVLGGAVFTLAVPVMLLVAGDLAGIIRYGAAAAAEVDAVKAAVVSWGIIAACVLGGTMGWVAFLRLEVADPSEGVRLPFSRRAGDAAHPRLHRPIAALVRKELHLQQMTLVVACLYVVLTLAAAAIEWRAPGAVRQAMWAIAGLTTAMLALLAGAIASADERQLGTHGWQLLQPVSSRTQWMVKAGAAFGCALLFGVAVPLLLSALQTGVADALGRMGPWRLTMSVVMLTSVGLYVSSLSASGIRALVISLGVVLGAWVVVGTVSVVLWEPAPTAILWQAASALRRAAPVGADTVRLLTGGVVVLAAGALAGMLTWFAGVNHRTIRADRGVFLRQIGALVLTLAASVALFNLLMLAASMGSDLDFRTTGRSAPSFENRDLTPIRGPSFKNQDLTPARPTHRKNFREMLNPRYQSS